MEALDQHNRLRSLVARGGTQQPPAADMRELEWDEELARVAQVGSLQKKSNLLKIV